MVPGPYAAHHYLPSWWVWIETGVGRFALADGRRCRSRRTGSRFWTLLAAAIVAAVGFIRRCGVPTCASPRALLVAVLAYVLLLHMSEVLLLVNNGGLLLQGRYLLPIVPLLEAVLLLGLARLGRVGVATALLLVVVTFAISVQGLTDTLVFFG